MYPFCVHFKALLNKLIIIYFILIESLKTAGNFSICLVSMINYNFLY